MKYNLIEFYIIVSFTICQTRWRFLCQKGGVGGRLKQLTPGNMNCFTGNKNNHGTASHNNHINIIYIVKMLIVN